MLADIDFSVYEVYEEAEVQMKGGEQSERSAPASPSQQVYNESANDDGDRHSNDAAVEGPGDSDGEGQGLGEGQGEVEGQGVGQGQGEVEGQGVGQGQEMERESARGLTAAGFCSRSNRKKKKKR